MRSLVKGTSRFPYKLNNLTFSVSTKLLDALTYWYAVGFIWVEKYQNICRYAETSPPPPGDNVQIHTKVVQLTHVRLKSIIKLSSKSFPITYFTDWVLSIHLCKHPTTFIMGPLSSAFDWTCSPSWVLCLPFSFIWEKVKNLINSQKLNIE